MQLSRIAVAGASGLIGSALTRSLTEDGHEVVRLVRREPKDGTEVRWDPEAGRVDTAGLAGCDAVVNLAGAGSVRAAGRTRTRSGSTTAG